MAVTKVSGKGQQKNNVQSRKEISTKFVKNLPPKNCTKFVKNYYSNRLFSFSFFFKFNFSLSSITHFYLFFLQIQVSLVDLGLTQKNDYSGFKKTNKHKETSGAKQGPLDWMSGFSQLLNWYIIYKFNCTKFPLLDFSSSSYVSRENKWYIEKFQLGLSVSALSQPQKE